MTIVQPRTPCGDIASYNGLMNEPKTFLSTFDREGWRKYHQTIFARSRKKFALITIGGFAMGILLFVLVYILQMLLPTLGAAMIFACCTALIIGQLARDYQKGALKKAIEFESSRPEPRTCTIAADYFEISLPNGWRTQIPWSMMKLKEKTETALVVEAGGPQPFTMMRSSLQSASLEEEFIARLST